MGLKGMKNQKQVTTGLFPLLIRRMTVDDLRFGLRLSRQAGWNQTMSDWQRFFNLGPEGCFVAELGGRLVGTTMTFVSDRVAWIAMVLVEKNARGKGIGTALLKHALAYLDACKVKTVRLDATHLGRPIYEKLGFKPEYELVRFEGNAPSGGAVRSVKNVTLKMLKNVIKFDKRMMGENRGKMLRALFDEFPENMRVLMQGRKLEGFVTVRSGSNAVQIGPCTATLNAGPDLLTDALNRCARKVVLIDIPTGNVRAVKIAESNGLEIQRRFLRMYRGRRITSNVSAIWASSGPEKG
jgi:GNAT superfamily N-acetyltransferase